MTVDLSSARPERNAQWLDTAVFLIACVLLLPSSITTLTNAGLPHGWYVGDVAAVLVLQLVVLTYRRWPVPTFVGACAAMLVLTLSPHPWAGDTPVPAAVLPSALLFFFALYAVAMLRDARTALGALAVALVGAALVSYRLSSTDWSSQLGSDTRAWLLLTGTAFVGAVTAWALGRLRATRIAFLAELEERARRTESDRVRDREQAAADERARIAAEMHDVVSHSLAVIVSQAEGGRMIAPDSRTRDVLQTIGSTGRTALADMRSMLGVLRSDDVRRGEPMPGIEGIPALVEQSGARLSVTGPARQTSPAVGLAAYRVVQESLTNSLKHAAGGAAVRLDWTNRLTITVTNPAGDPGAPAGGSGVVGGGSGMVGGGSPADAAGDGSGIVGMRQRAEAVGGSLEAGLVDGAWRVVAVLPLEDR